MKLSSHSFINFCSFLVLALASQNALLAQQPRPLPLKLGAPGTHLGKTTAGKQKPCWQEAGISKAAMEERRSIQQSARQQIEAICSQPGLSDKQRNEEIGAVNQATRQKLVGLITPSQQETLRACNEARAANAAPHPHPAGGVHAGGGPCVQFGH